MNAALLGAARRVNDKKLVVPTAGLIALYDFVQGPDPQLLYDRSGNGFHGSLGAEATPDSADPTWTAQGLVFDGVDDKIELPNLPGSSGVGTFLFSVPNAATSGVATVYSQSNQSPTIGFYWIYRNAGSGTVITFQYSKGNGTGNAAAVATWATGDLCGIVADYNTGNIKFFRNGDLVSASVMDTPVLPPQAISRIGRYFSNTQGSTGLISFFARYDRTFTDGEMSRASRAVRRILTRRGVPIS